MSSSEQEELSEHKETTPTSSLFAQTGSTSIEPVPTDASNGVHKDLESISQTSTTSFHTATVPENAETGVPATEISELYDEIEPEYKRLTLGSLDFDKIDFNQLSSDWQKLKGSDATPPVGTGAAESRRNNDEATQASNNNKASQFNAPPLATTEAAARPYVSSGHQEDELVEPEVLVTTARKQQIRPDEESYDDRPDAAKIEDLKRFAYAHGSARSNSIKPKTQPQRKVVSPTSEPRAHSSAATSEKADIKIPVAPGETLSFSRKSKVSKLLGLKADSQSTDTKQRQSDSDLTDDENVVGAAQADDAHDTPLGTSATTTRQSSTVRASPFRRTGTSTDSLASSDQTAKRALLIKAAHLEVCNHLTRSARMDNGAVQSDGNHVINLSGLSFWHRLTDLEKSKSQPTIIEIMNRYSHETHFSDDSLDQAITRSGSSSAANEAAVSLDPKTDLPLSTDIDNEVGRSKAAAEYIIEHLSEKLASTTFHDEGDNVFKVPIKGKSPLARIEGDKEWRLVQEAVSAHALGRGYQIQMGDGPEDITKPWQVRQKGDLKDALASFTKWPSASELVWIKVNRLGV